EVTLTPAWHEGGSDLFGLLAVYRSTHDFSGTSSPILIVGQSKKYWSPVSVDKVKEFALTLEQVRHRSPQVPIPLPTWFVLSRGPVVGWMLAHSGFQTGAADFA